MGLALEYRTGTFANPRFSSIGRIFSAHSVLSRLRRTLLILGGDGVASLFLREVEGAVCAVNEGAEAVLLAVPGGYAKAEGDAVKAVFEDAAEVLAECDHRLEVVVQGEQDELVAAVADEEVTAVDLLVDGVRVSLTVLK